MEVAFPSLRSVIAAAGQRGSPGRFGFTVRSVTVAHRPEAAVLLLEDLRETYATAHRAEIAWVILQQGAKAGATRSS